MDWLSLGLVLLAVSSNIEAQQGYNYPRPKTPFPLGGGGSGSQPDRGTGTQIPFGTQQSSNVPTGAQTPLQESQQPSVGYTAGTIGPFGTTQPTGGVQQPSGGYSTGGQTGTLSGTAGTFGINRPSDGTQIGTSSGSQRPFGTQPTGGYSTVGPSGIGGATLGTFGTSAGTQGPFGAQQSAGGYPSTGSVTSSGYPSTQQPSVGYPTQTGTSTGIQKPFGTQGQPGQQTGTGSFALQQPLTGFQQTGVSGDRPFGSQQPGRSGGGRKIDFESSSGVGRPQEGLTTSTTGSQQGYSYPSPQGQFSGTGQRGTIGASTSSGSRPGTDGSFVQSPSISSSVDRPFGGSGFPGSTQFGSDREGTLRSQNGYTTPGLETPAGTSQQRVGGYSQTGLSQGSPPSGAQYPSSRPQGLADKRGRGEFSGEERPVAFPVGQGGYTGIEGTQGVPSQGVTQPSGRVGGQIQGYPRSQESATSQFPSDGSRQVSVPSERPGFAGTTTSSQFPSSGVQGPSGTLDNQVTSGFPSTTTSGQISSTVGRPSRPQFPSGVSQNRLSSTGYQSYLPPEQPGTGGLPLADVPSSQFPSDDFTSTDSRPQAGSIGGFRPSGDVKQPIQPQAGYTRPDVSGGAQSLSGASRQPIRPQSGRSDVSNEYERPSGVVEQPIQQQVGYSRPGVSPSSQGASGQSSQGGYGRPDVSTDSQRLPGASGQPIQQQSGYSRPGTSPGSQSPSGQPGQAGYGRPDVSTDSQRPSGASGQPILPQSGYSRPGTSPGSQSPSGQPSQAGYGRPGVSTDSQRPSGASGQPIQQQSGYSRPGTSSGSQSPSGQPSQVGYGRPDVSTDSQRLPGASGQPIQQQSGYSRPGVLSQSPSGTLQQPSQAQNGYPDVAPEGISESKRPSGSGVPSTFQQSTSSQNGYGTSGATLPGSQFTSGISGQPSSTLNRQNAPLIPSEGGSSGRPFGAQSPATGGQIESSSEQGTSRFGKPSTTQEFARPGSAGRSEPGYSLDQAVQEGFPRRTGGRTLPGFQQGTRNFIPSQEPSDDGSYQEEEGDGDFSAIPGQPGRDYPILSEVPETSFTCDNQEFRGYYADVETRCQIFHICSNNKTYDFICPNGTIFHQENLVCVWWDQFDCETAPSLYRINEHIYDFSIFGAEQTGGIPFPGQEYPEFQRGQQGFPLERTPGGGVGGQRPQGPGQRPLSPRLDDGSPSQGSQAPSGSSTTIGGQQGTQGYQRPSGTFQRPGGYSTERTQGVPTSSSSGYPSNAPQGTGTYQTPSGAPQVSGNGFQGPAGGQGTQQYQGPSGSHQRPGGAVQRPGEESQGPSGSYQRPGSAVQRPGEESQGPTGSGVSGYPTGRGGQPQAQGFPTGSGAILEQRPSGRGGKSRPIFPTGSGGQLPEDGSSSERDGGYSTGSTRRPSSSQTSVPSTGEVSSFPGSPQPHEPTREYLPVA